MTEPIKLALIGAGSSYAPDLASIAREYIATETTNDAGGHNG